MIWFEKYGLPWGCHPGPVSKWGTSMWYSKQREKHAFDAKFLHKFY